MTSANVPDSDVTYAEISQMVDEHLEFHLGEVFSLNDAKRWINRYSGTDGKHLSTKLGNLVRKGVLEKRESPRGSLFRYVNRRKCVIGWNETVSDDKLDIQWPKSHEPGDDSTFGFDGRIVVRPSDLIVVAGVSNSGKSTFAKNFLAENIECWDGRMQMMVNEHSPRRFKETMDRLDWAKCTANGKPRFELIRQDKDWQDVVEPDWINIIDWIGLENNFWEIRSVLENIRAKLKGGIALILLQKKRDALFGEGGNFTESPASVYLGMDFGRITVVKIKEAVGIGSKLDGSVWGFDLNQGAHFSNIRHIKPCSTCRKLVSPSCYECRGTGYSTVTMPKNYLAENTNRR